MVNIEFKAAGYSLEAKGHAMFAPKGTDIVCSAVSVLFEALAACLTDNKDMLMEDPYILMDDGLSVISCKPREECEKHIALMYLPILHGLELVSLNYPNNVSFEVGDRKAKHQSNRISSKESQT